jgi:hypothetical protein
MRCDSEMVKDSPYGHGGEGSNFKLIKLTWQEYIYNLFYFLYIYIYTHGPENVSCVWLTINNLAQFVFLIYIV